jgi:hypothetical protein
MSESKIKFTNVSAEEMAQSLAEHVANPDLVIQTDKWSANSEDVAFSLAQIIRNLQPGLSCEVRIALWDRITECYCRSCGRMLSAGEVCHCENDD